VAPAGRGLGSPRSAGTYVVKLGRDFRLAFFLGLTVPIGMGGGNTPNPAVAAAMKAELTKWAAAFEKENDRPPSRGEKTQFKGEIRQMLRNRATPRTAVLDVSWNLKTQQVQIWAASRKTVDEIMVALESALSVKFTGMTPADHARTEGLDEASLGPTAELIGMDLPATAVEEVSHGGA